MESSNQAIIGIVELVESEMEVPAQYNITGSHGIDLYSCLQYKWWFSSHSTGCLRGEKKERRKNRKEKGRDRGKSSAFYLLS